MTNPRAEQPFMTPEEYLAFEANSPTRHEYVAGGVHAMSGGSARHARIFGNVFAHLREAAAGGPCEAFTQSMKVRADETSFYYPDVVVTCSPVDDEAVVTPTPCVVVEVLSPSTRLTDTREKLAAYRRIPTLRAYLIVETRYPRVERHWRDEQGTWRAEIALPESGGRVSVPCPEVVLTLDEIYAGVTYPPRLRRVRERRVRERAPAAAPA